VPQINKTLLNRLKMNKFILDRIQELFFEKLATKTGWGRNELKEAYINSVNKALKEYLDAI